MLILRGVNFYPLQVERVLMGLPEVGSNYCLVLTRENNLDQLTVQVELSPDYAVDDLRQVESLRERIARTCARIALPVHVRAFTGQAAGSRAKAVRVIETVPRFQACAGRRASRPTLSGWPHSATPRPPAFAAGPPRRGEHTQRLGEVLSASCSSR